MARARNILRMAFVTALLFCFASPAAAGQSAQGARGGPEAVPTSFPPPQGPQQSLQEGRGGTVTLNLQDVPLQSVLQMLSVRMGKKFVPRPDVKDLPVTAYLPDVPLKDAIAAILQVHDLRAQELGGGIVVVSRKPKEKAAPAQAAPAVRTELVRLRYLDAGDVKETLEPLLTPVGRIAVVKRSGHTGWQFQRSKSGADRAGRGGTRGGVQTTTFAPGPRAGTSYKKEVASQLLVITDTAKNVEFLLRLIDKIDVRPPQVLITAKLVEVNRDKLRDIGVDLGTGKTGAESSAIMSTSPWGGSTTGSGIRFRGNSLGSQVAPGNWNPKASLSGTFPFDAGMTLVWRKIGGTDFEMIIHALEEKANANILSAPQLLVLNNQEAVILVGTMFPILETEVTGTTVAQVTTSLDYYENIGIQLSVVPQVQDGHYINMIVHPAVRNQSGTVQARGTGGEILAEYPIIENREAETQILINDGQTILIGGLLKDTKTLNVVGVPFLKDIPVIGALFRRTTRDNQKVDLIIFLTATIVKHPSEAQEANIRAMQNDHTIPLESLEQAPQGEQQQTGEEPAPRAARQEAPATQTPAPNEGH